MPALFDRAAVETALNELANRLVERGARVQLRVVGGAAIAILHDRPALTSDIDALYGASSDVDDVVAAIAAEWNWPPTWLNNAVKMYASDYDDTAEWRLHVERGDVRILVAPSDLLLAMKLRAGRGRRDSGDIDVLLDGCGVRSRAEAIEIFDRYYPHEAIAEAAARQLAVRFPDD